MMAFYGIDGAINKTKIHRSKDVIKLFNGQRNQ